MSVSVLPASSTTDRQTHARAVIHPVHRAMKLVLARLAQLVKSLERMESASAPKAPSLTHLRRLARPVDHLVRRALQRISAIHAPLDSR